MAGVEGGEGDAVGGEVIVAWEEVVDESSGREYVDRRGGGVKKTTGV